MNKEAQRIAIAEACGIEVAPCTCKSNPWIDAKTRKHLPDYLNDLNAMHEASETLDTLTYEKYALTVGIVIQSDSSDVIYRLPLDATAEQRAEAFLKTIGKWQVSVDEENP